MERVTRNEMPGIQQLPVLNLGCDFGYASIARGVKKGKDLLKCFVLKWFPIKTFDQQNNCGYNVVLAGVSAECCCLFGHFREEWHHCHFMVLWPCINQQWNYLWELWKIFTCISKIHFEVVLPCILLAWWTFSLVASFPSAADSRSKMWHHQLLFRIRMHFRIWIQLNVLLIWGKLWKLCSHFLPLSLKLPWTFSRIVVPDFSIIGWVRVTHHYVKILFIYRQFVTYWHQWICHSGDIGYFKMAGLHPRSLLRVDIRIYFDFEQGKIW